jgi:hypothetical protein
MWEWIQSRPDVCSCCRGLLFLVRQWSILDGVKHKEKNYEDMVSHRSAVRSRDLRNDPDLSAPLAILFNNQGLVKNEFRAGLALVRVAESSVTAVVYYHLGLFIAESENIFLVFIRSVLIGIPLGAYVIRRLDAETFRRHQASNMIELCHIAREY